MFLFFILLLPLAKASVVLNATDFISFNISSSEIARIITGGLVVSGGWINASDLNASNSVRASQICIGSDCRTSWPSLSESDPYWNANISAISNNYLVKRSGAGIGASVIYDTGSLVNVSAGNLNIHSGALQIGGTNVIDSSRNLVGINLVNQNLNMNSNSIYNAAWVNASNIYASGTIYGNVQGSITSTGNLNMNNYDIYNVKNVNATNLFASGNVGIGTTSPDSTLHVIGGLCVESSDTGCAAISGTIRASSFYDKDDTSFYLDPHATSVLKNLQVTQSAYLATSAGYNVGIGTTSPSAKLEIEGSGTGGLSLNASNVLFVNATSGNVGIGTTGPAYKLDVNGDIRTTGISRLAYASSSQNIHIGETVDNWNGLNLLNIRVGDPGIAPTRTLGLYGNKVAIYATDFVVPSGNVGIGTTTPQAKLDVAGNVKIGSSSTTCDANHRGEFRVELGASGVDDKLWMCMQNSTNSYNWVLVARGG
jgi:hypothetical protein